jgi:micrococcal nuclease
LGVDTPETSFGSVSPDEFEGISDGYDGQDHLFNWGEKATTYAEDKLAGKEVRIEVDDEADRRGYYGRLLVYIYVDGGNFNKQLLTNGYARVYES